MPVNYHSIVASNPTFPSIDLPKPRPDGRSLISYLGCFRCEHAVRAGKPVARASHLHTHDPILRRAEPESPMRSRGHATTVVEDVSYSP